MEFCKRLLCLGHSEQRRSDRLSLVGFQNIPVVLILFNGFDINESEITPIRRLTAPGLHFAIRGDEETSAIRILFESNEDVDRDPVCSGSSKVRSADIPWTHMHGPHMNGLWRRATSSDKNVIFLGVAVREPRIETASQEFVPDQSRARRACRNARPARLFGFAF